MASLFEFAYWQRGGTRNSRWQTYIFIILPGSAGGILLGGLCKKSPPAVSRESISGKSGAEVLTIRDCKIPSLQSAPRPFSRQAVSNYGLPLFDPDVVNILERRKHGQLFYFKSHAAGK